VPLLQATSPRSSAPRTRRRAMVSSMQSTANMTRSRPSVLGGGSCWSALNAAGVRYSVSSSLLWPPRGCASSRCHSGRRRGRRCGQPRGLRSAPSFRLLTELGKRTRSRVQVVDSEGDLVHPLNGHVSELTVPLRPCWRTCRRGGFASPRPLVQATWKSCVTPPRFGADQAAPSPWHRSASHSHRNYS